MFKLFKILFLSSKSSFLFISFIIFTSLFSFIFTGNLIYSIETYIKNSSKDFIGADIVINTRDNLLNKTEEYIKNNYEADSSKKISFDTSIFKNNKPDLYSINYIEKNYPFYGTFDITTTDNNGELIVSKKVFDRFGTGAINLLGNDYKIKGYLTENFLINLNPFGGNDIYLDYEKLDISSLDKISRIRYEILLKTKQVKQISNDKFFEKFRISTQETSNDNINEIINRLNIFVQLFYQIIILLAFFIVIISLNSYFKKVSTNLKVLNILGVPNYKIIINFSILFFIIALISSSLGYLSVYWIFEIFKEKFDILILDTSLYYKSNFIALLIIFSGSLLNLLNLKTTSINNYEKNDLLKEYKKYIISYFMFLIIILFFIARFSGISIVYSFILSIGFTIFLLFIIYILRLLLSFIFYKNKNRLKSNFYLFDAIRSTIKPGNLSLIIIISTFVSISGFLIFFTLSNNFIDYLNKNIDGKINTFVINLDEDDLPIIKKYFNKNEYYEIIQSRILNINDNTLKIHLDTDNVSGRFTREFNTTTKSLNELIIKGKPLSSGTVGVDEEFAESLGVNIGDTIHFLILGIEKELKIVQIRKAERNGLTPFFYFNFYEDDFKGFSKNYFLSYNSKEKDNDFNLNFSKMIGSEATFIDISSIVERIKSLSNYVLSFMYVILAYIGFFSIITFISSVNFLKSFKEKKVEIYNKFGGIKQKLKKAIFYEYSYLILLGFIISIIFSLCVSTIIFLSNEYINFEISFFFQSILLTGIFLFIYLIIYFIIYKK